MVGAILGDMIGVPFEFDRGTKTKDFTLLTQASRFSDDTVMTVAIADALLQSDGSIADTRMKFIECMRKWGNKYPNAGYGGMFAGWLFSQKPQPYNSYGNGSAMRVSPIGWWFDSLYETAMYARLSAGVTHNHIEGIRGAEAIAGCIFLARTGHTKEEIKNYVLNYIGYDLSKTIDEIRPSYRMNATCQGSVPQAITAFLEGTSYEDCVRTAVSIGGDTDTIGAITGSIAEAFYGIPSELKVECGNRLPEDMKAVVSEFYKKRKGKL